MSSNEEIAQLIARNWKYAAPDWRIYDGLVDEGIDAATAAAIEAERRILPLGKDEPHD